MEEALLKQLGFSDEFIRIINNYQKDITVYAQNDFSDSKIKLKTVDSNNIIIKSTKNLTGTDCYIHSQDS